jgi:hypothetical protein
MSRWNYLLCIALMAVASGTAAAQMTIFNIPSTDVLPKKSAYIEADLITKPVKFSKGGFQTYGWRVVYGIGARTEVGANVYYTRDSLGSARDLQFSVKTSLYQNEEHGFAWSAGGIVSTPIHDERGAKTYAVLYSNVSKTIESVHGLRVTTGVYHVVGGGKGFGTKTGALIGIEQPITRRFSFLGDWASGKNRFGYAAAGFAFQFTKKQYIAAGYNFGNEGRGNNYLTVFWGYTF